MHNAFSYFFVFILGFSLHFPQQGHAQAFSDIRFGVRGGLNLSTINSQGLADRSPRIGYQISGFVSLFFNESFSLQPELQIGSRGGIQTYEPMPNNSLVDAVGEAEIFVAYLDFVLPLRVTIAQTISLHAGPYVGHLLDTDINLAGDVANALADSPGREAVNSWDLGLVLGGGLTIDDVTIGFRYCPALTRLADNNNGHLLMGGGKNRSLQGFITIIL